MTTLELVPPCAFLNANGRLHWRAKAKLTATWRAAAAEAAYELGPITFTRAHVTFGIRFPDNRRRDVGNWYPTAKACLDGIVSAGLLVDDSDDHVLGPDLRRIRPNGSPLVVVTLEEIAA